MGTALADPFRNLKIRSPDILKQFGYILSHCRVLLEQQLLKHHLVDSDHLPQVQSVKVHDEAISFRRSSGSPPEHSLKPIVHWTMASNFAGASQAPSILNRTTESVLTEIAFGGGTSSLTSSV